MITVSTKQLFEAIAEADVFRLPEMSAGTTYLYDNIYGRLSSGKDVTLSGLDFDAFDSDDISLMCDIYSDVFERNEYTASGIMSSLRGTDPVGSLPYYILSMPNNNDYFKPSNNKLGLEMRDLLELIKDKQPEFYYNDILISNGAVLNDFINDRRR